MYTPHHFKQDDHPTIIQMMRDNAFASVISCVDTQPFVSHIPLLIDDRNAADGRPEVTIRGHLAYANEHWRHFEANPDVTILFQGPHCYISPTWYENPGLPPTWNYTAVHVQGRTRIVEDPADLKRIIEELAETYEQNRPSPWQPDYPDAMLSAIVGFEIEVTNIEAKFKLSQNRKHEDIHRVIEHLQESNQENERQISALMQKEEISKV